MGLAWFFGGAWQELRCSESLYVDPLDVVRTLQAGCRSHLLIWVYTLG